MRFCHRSYPFRLLLLLAIAGCGGPGGGGPAAKTNSNDVAAGATSAEPADIKSGFDLARIAKFKIQVGAITEEQLGEEPVKVQEIMEWSLNRRGQLAVHVCNASDNGRIESDLYLIDGAKRTCLLKQRGSGPFDERRVSQFSGGALDKSGAVLTDVRGSDPDKPWRLFLVDAKQVRAVPDSDAPEGFRGESLLGSQGQVAFFAPTAGSQHARLMQSDGVNTQVCAAAHKDPFDPNRRLRSFGWLLATNARGQILFDGTLHDRFDGTIRLERMCLYTPPQAGESDAPTGQRGQVREVAIKGETLRGTKLTMGSREDFGFYGAALGDRGDVVMVSDRAHEYDERVAQGLVVLRPGQSDWQTILESGEPLGQPARKIGSIGFPSINGRGQIACAVGVITGEYYETALQLIRVEPDGKLTVLAQSGDKLEAGVILDDIAHPQILSDGSIVFLTGKRLPVGAEPVDQAIVVTDGTRQRVVLRQSDVADELSRFMRPKIVEFRACEAGTIGVKVEGASPFDGALLLVKPALP
jgi:hypothetical protein